MHAVDDFLFPAVLNSLWMIPLLVMAVEAGTRFFGQIRGAMLYRIWMAVFFLALLLPMLPALAVQSAERGIAAITAHPFLAQTQEAPRSANPPALWKAESYVAVFYSQQVAPARKEGGLDTFCCLFYGACFLLALLRMQVGIAHTRRVIRDAAAVFLSEDAERGLQQAVLYYGLTPVDVLSSRYLDSPAAVHWPRAVIILPKSFEGVNVEEMLTVFSHELAHIKRRDFFANLLVELLGSLLYFHPALHWMRKRIAESRELATDELASEAMQSRTAYARSLVRLAERFHSKSIIEPICSLGIFEGGTLEKRIMNLTEKRYSTRQMAIATLSTALLVLAVSIFSARRGMNPLRAEQLRAASQAPPPQAAHNSETTWDIPPEVDWIVHGARPGRWAQPDIKMIFDKKDSYKGESTYLFQYIGDTKTYRGSFAERFIDAKPYLGKRVNVHTMVRSMGDLKHPIWLTLFTPTNVLFETNYMNSQKNQNNAGWTGVDFTVDVPRNARSIYLKIVTEGKFKVWVNEPQVEIIKTSA